MFYMSSKLTFILNLLHFAVLYNLGLAFQLLGRFKYEGDRQGHWLRQALQSYQMAIDVFQACSHVQTHRMFFLAVTNNKGSIHSYFHESNESQHCLDWLKKVLEERPESCEEEYDVFHWNVVLLRGHETAAPAA